MTVTYPFAGFVGALVAQLFKEHARDFYVDVYPVQHRTGYSFLTALYHRNRVGAFFFRVDEKAAGAGIHAICLLLRW